MRLELGSSHDGEHKHAKESQVSECKSRLQLITEPVEVRAEGNPAALLLSIFGQIANSRTRCTSRYHQHRQHLSAGTTIKTCAAWLFQKHIHTTTVY